MSASPGPEEQHQLPQEWQVVQMCCGVQVWLGALLPGDPGHGGPTKVHCSEKDWYRASAIAQGGKVHTPEDPCLEFW